MQTRCEPYEWIRFSSLLQGSDDGFALGAPVAVRTLMSRPDLVGKVGVLTDTRLPNPERVVVRFENGENLSIKRVNLTLVRKGNGEGLKVRTGSSWVMDENGIDLRDI